MKFISKITVLVCLIIFFVSTPDESSEQVEGSDTIDNTELTGHDNADDLATDEIENLLYGTWTMRGQTVIIESLIKTSVTNDEVSEGIIIDYDGEGNIVGIDIDNASKKIDLEDL